MTLTALPPLHWTGASGTAEFSPEGDSVTLTAAAGTDWSNDSLGGEGQHAATGLVFDAPASFALSARVTVPFPRTTFDAGVLCLWVDDDHWAKLCFEFSPSGQAMVVSVVTNGFSDDANSTIVDGESVYLRVSRVGPAWAFHASSDGLDWEFVRLFRLETDAPVGVGFLAQAPMGDSCRATFDQIRLNAAPPSYLRDGS